MTFQGNRKGINGTWEKVGVYVFLCRYAAVVEVVDVVVGVCVWGGGWIVSFTNCIGSCSRTGLNLCVSGFGR